MKRKGLTSTLSRSFINGRLQEVSNLKSPNPLKYQSQVFSIHASKGKLFNQESFWTKENPEKSQQRQRVILAHYIILVKKMNQIHWITFQKVRKVRILLVRSKWKEKEKIKRRKSVNSKRKKRKSLSSEELILIWLIIHFSIWIPLLRVSKDCRYPLIQEFQPQTSKILRQIKIDTIWGPFSEIKSTWKVLGC